MKIIEYRGCEYCGSRTAVAENCRSCGAPDMWKLWESGVETETPFFVDGGVSLRNDEDSFSAVWA